MTTSNSNKTPPGAPNSYTRFIPREELKGFAAWNPNSLEDPAAPRAAPGESSAGGGIHKAPFSVRAGVDGVATEPVEPSTQARSAAADAATATAHPAGKPKATRPPEPKPEPKVNVDTLVKEARHSGYQDGYRDGLAALESYKQTQSAQMAAFMSDQVGALVSDLHQRLELLEAQLSGRIAGVALELARQVVRSEIATRPELVVSVAEDAMSTILSSARSIVLRLNPDDLAMAHGSLDEQLKARGARLVGDPHVAQGGCLVESDIAVVDASVEARWNRVAAAMGIEMDWNADPEHTAPMPLEVPEGDSRWLDDLQPRADEGTSS